MSKESDNKAIVGRWFTDFWGEKCNLAIVDELAAPDMLLLYSLHEPRRGRDDIKAIMTDFRTAFPDLSFWGTADLIAEGDYVVGRWEGGGTHTGPAFSDFQSEELSGYCRAPPERTRDALSRDPHCASTTFTVVAAARSSTSM
jgi:SnoaL-like polyketide cyclase